MADLAIAIPIEAAIGSSGTPGAPDRARMTSGSGTSNSAGKRSTSTKPDGDRWPAGLMSAEGRTSSKLERNAFETADATGFTATVDGGNTRRCASYPVDMACQSVIPLSSMATAHVAAEPARPVAELYQTKAGRAPYPFHPARPCRDGRASGPTGIAVSKNIRAGCAPFEMVPMPGNLSWGGLAERAAQFTHTGPIDG